MNFGHGRLGVAFWPSAKSWPVAEYCTVFNVSTPIAFDAAATTAFASCADPVHTSNAASPTEITQFFHMTSSRLKHEIDDSFVPLENRERIEGKPGTAGHRHRPERQHELPAIELRRRLADGLEILVVEQVDPQSRDKEGVNRQRDAFDLRRRHVRRRVAADQRDAALLHPWRHRRVQAGGVLADVPRS